jgi:TP901 family phage tail tape measure protein
MAFNIAYTYQLIDKYTAPIQKIIAATRAHTRYLKENQDAIKASNATLTKMANRSERLHGSLKALEGNNALKHLTTQAKELNQQIDKMGRAKLPGLTGGGATGVSGGVSAGRGRLSRFGAAASGLTGVGAGIGISTVMKQTAAVENAMIDMGRATDLPAAELKKFEERFMTLSEQIGISTDKLAIMAFEGSKTGIDTKDLDRYVKLTANAAVSFEILEQEAGRALGSIKAKMGMNIGQLEELMDRVNSVADATSADGERMINIIERLSGTFNTLKLKPEVAAGFAAVADQLETSPELAASGMNMVINKMMKSSTLAKKMFEAPAETMRAVFTKLAKMPEAKRIAAATKMFGDEAGRFAVKLAGNMELFDATMKKAADAKAMGSMEREMASKLKSLSMLWKNMSNAVTNVMVAIGEGLAPDIKRFGEYLREVTPKIREFVREHPGVIKLAAGIVAVVAAITLAVPIVWALWSAFSFVAAALVLIASPLGLAVAGIAALGGAIAWRWDDWVASGHPVPELIGSIADRVGRLISKFTEIVGESPLLSKVLALVGNAFDAIGYSLAIPLKLLDAYLAVLEKIVGTQDKVQTLGVMAGAGQNISSLTPPNINSALSLDKIIGGQNNQTTVGGTIKVQAEPGTKATIQQPSLPTGNNVRLAQ